MEEVSIDTQTAKVLNFVKGFKAAHLINLGVKLGIFEALNEAKDGITVSDLASKLRLHEPYLKIWCQTAYHFEILDIDSEGRFRFQPFLDEVLGDRTSYRNWLGNVAISVDIQGDRFIKSPDYFRSGKIIEGYTPERSDSMAEASKQITLAFLNIIFPQNQHLKQMLEKGVRFLDIGCGQAGLIIELAQTFEKSTFVGAEPVTYSTEKVKKRISELGLEERVSVENMGGEALPFDDEFDMINMSVTFHEIVPDVRVKVMENAYRALKTGGKLLIFDFKYPDKIEDFRNPEYMPGVVDAFDEIVLGVVHLNQQEQNEFFTGLGFKDIQRMDIEGFTGLEIITATK